MFSFYHGVYSNISSDPEHYYINVVIPVFKTLIHSLEKYGNDEKLMSIFEKYPRFTMEQYLTTFRENISLTSERNNLTIERDSLVIEKINLLSSRSWRFTEPLRKIGAFIRLHKFLHLLVKRLLLIKRKISSSMS
jgi:hypothetical protein